ncbi:MAG TPA: hypothetical protein VF331_11495 [Polyangiales bacterium]
MGQTARVTWCGATVLLLAACTSTTHAPSDAGSSGRQPKVDASTDASLDGSDPSCPALLATYDGYVKSHQACTHDTDCAVLDGCDCAVDWVTVNQAAADALLMMRNDVFYSHGCKSSQECDGPVFDATCDVGRCVLHGLPTDQWCGMAPSYAHLELAPSPWSTGQPTSVRPSLTVSGWTSDHSVFDGTLQLRTYPGDVPVPTQGHLDASPDDAGTVASGSNGDSFAYRLTPAQPLQTGWYALRLSLPASTAAQLAHAALPSDGTYVTYFRVGSAPYLLGVGAGPSMSADLFPKLNFTFSEAVRIPDPLPIAVTADGVAASCVFNDTPRQAYETLALRCDPPVPASALERITISEGITSALDGTPLRNAAGQTRFSIELAHDAGLGVWSEPSTKPPSF